ncbi:MAG: mechanosensitive ion channel [Halobacteriota archaeon]|nr:mechanosensitive ion channel [Halobacteriota archaeon]
MSSKEEWRRQTSRNFVEFLARFLSVLLYMMVILLAVGALGFSVNSVVLGLSAIIGLVLAFGMQETLGNLVAGVWIGALRPLDEVVDINGMTGKVTAVGIMAAELLTYDNAFITIPNNLVLGAPIINYTRMPTIRVDVAVGISYDSDVTNAVSVAMNLIKEHKMVLDNPASAVVTTELADSSVNLQLK